METRKALRAAFISPDSNDNLTRAILALPESISLEGMLIFNTSVSSTGKYIPCLASNKTRQCVF